MLARVLITFSGIAFASSVFGQVEYGATNPALGLTQNSGVSLSDGKVLESALKSNEFVLPSSSSVTETGSRSTVSSFESLFEATGFDISLAARFASVSGSASLSTQLERAYAKNSFIYTISYKQVFDWSELKDRSLKSEAQELLTSGKSVEFLARYGDHFVSRVQRGNALTVSFIVDNVKQSSRESLSVALDLAYQGLGDSASLSAKFKSLAEKLSVGSSLRVEFTKIGSAKLRAGTLLTSGNIEKVAQEISQCISQMSIQTAGIVGLELTPYPELSSAPIDSLLGATWTRMSLRATNNRKIRRIEDAQSNLLTSCSWVTAADRKALANSLEVLKQQNKSLSEELMVLRKLKSDKEWADENKVDPEDINVPWPKATITMNPPLVQDGNGNTQGIVSFTGGEFTLTAYAVSSQSVFANGQWPEKTPTGGTVVRFKNWNSPQPGEQYLRVFGPEGQTIPGLSEIKTMFNVPGTIATLEI